MVSDTPSLTFHVRRHLSDEEVALAPAQLLDRPPGPRDEIQRGGRWQLISEVIPEDPWLARPTTMVLGLLAWIQALLMMQVGIHLQLLTLAGASGAAAVLLLRSQLRWGMSLGVLASFAAIGRGVLDTARGFSIGLTGGAWLWLIAPGILGVLGLSMTLLWWWRSPSATARGFRLLTALTSEETAEQLRESHTRERFADVPFGIPLAVLVLLAPYAAHFARPMSALAFSGLIGAGGLGLLVYAVVVRRASARSAGLDPGSVVQDLPYAAGVLAMLLVGTYTAFNLLDAVEMILAGAAAAAGPGGGEAAAVAAEAIGDASAGMAAESAAKEVVIAAGTTWRPWVIAVVAGVGEELAFRGGLYAALRTRLSPRWAIPLSAIPFAVLHFEPFQTAQLAMGGMVLAAVYESRRNLWAPIAVHVAWNLVLTALST